MITKDVGNTTDGNVPWVISGTQNPAISKAENGVPNAAEKNYPRNLGEKMALPFIQSLRNQEAESSFPQLSQKTPSNTLNGNVLKVIAGALR